MWYIVCCCYTCANITVNGPLFFQRPGNYDMRRRMDPMKMVVCIYNYTYMILLYVVLRV